MILQVHLNDGAIRCDTFHFRRDRLTQVRPPIVRLSYSYRFPDCRKANVG